MRRCLLVLVAALLSAATFSAPAAVDPQPFDSPAQEAQYKGLIAELRCLVCQNQNLADSDADLAQDLRTQVYEMVKSGSSDQQVIDYMVARYGEFVLYRPPLQSTTLLLWSGPFILVAVALLVLIRSVRRRAAITAPPAPEPDDAGTHVELPEGSPRQ